MSYISSVNTVGSLVGDTRSGGIEAGASLGKKDFLQLLIAQLKHQDPLAPMEDKEFIAQLAQFSVLEEIQGLNGSFSNFIGRDAYYQDMNSAMNLLGWHVKTDSGKEGIVAKAGFKDGLWQVFLEDGTGIHPLEIIETKKVNK